MRSVALILAVFFVGLSFIPCDDSDLDQENSITVAANQQDHNHDSEGDLCSPFCICHCCHSHFVVQHNFCSRQTEHPDVIKNTNYSDSLTEGFKMSVLQPPKV